MVKEQTRAAGRASAHGQSHQDGAMGPQEEGVSWLGESPWRKVPYSQPGAQNPTRGDHQLGGQTDLGTEHPAVLFCQHRSWSWWDLSLAKAEQTPAVPQHLGVKQRVPTLQPAARPDKGLSQHQPGARTTPPSSVTHWLPHNSLQSFHSSNTPGRLLTQAPRGT